MHEMIAICAVAAMAMTVMALVFDAATFLAVSPAIDPPLLLQLIGAS